jgi:hypothetical protein
VAVKRKSPHRERRGLVEHADNLEQETHLIVTALAHRIIVWDGIAPTNAGKPIGVCRNALDDCQASIGG